MEDIHDIHICGGCGSKFTHVFPFLHHKGQCHPLKAANIVKAGSQSVTEERPQQATTHLFESQSSSVESQHHSNGAIQIHLPFVEGCEHDQLKSTSNNALGDFVDNGHYPIPFSLFHDQTKVLVSCIHPEFTNRITVQDAGGNISGSKQQRNSKITPLDDVSAYVVNPRHLVSSGKDHSDVSNSSVNNRMVRLKNVSTDISNNLSSSGYLIGDSKSIRLSKDVGLVGITPCQMTDTTNLNSLAAQIASQAHTKHFLEAELISECSTPCPEDLEVGQISAAMLGDQQSYQRAMNEAIPCDSQPDDFNYCISTSTGSKILSEQQYKSTEYVRENTASAPIIKDSSIRKAAVEKRERLQGVSDDLFTSSPYQNITKKKTNCKDNVSQAYTQTNSTSAVFKPSSGHHMSQLAGFRAVFTSPSSAGHRLNPNFAQTGPSKHVTSHNNDHSFLKNQTDNPSSVLYTNISSAASSAQRVNRQQGTGSGKGKRVERKITFNGREDILLGEISTDGSKVENHVSSNSIQHTSFASVDESLAHVSGADITTRDVIGLTGTSEGMAGKMEESLSFPQHSTPRAMIQLCAPLENSEPSQTFSPALDENAILMVYNSDNEKYILVPKEDCAYSAELINLTSLHNINLPDACNVTQGHHDTQPGLGSSELYINIIPSGAECTTPELLVHNIFCSNHQWVISTGNSLSQPGSGALTGSLSTLAESVFENTSSPKQGVVKIDTTPQSNPEREKSIRKPKKALVKPPTATSSKKNVVTKKLKAVYALEEHVNGKLSTDDGQDGRKNKVFICKFDNCRYTTTLYKDFQRHYRRHTGEKPFRCEECDKRFSRADKLNMHMRSHRGVKHFKCHLCDYSSVESGSLKKHLRIHNDERPYKCQICSYASRNSSQLIVHLRTHTGDTPFHCTQCTAKFKVNSDLKRHIRTHTGEKPFKCDFCDYRSTNKSNLKTHVRINHSKENEISCTQCDFVTSSKKRLREHVKVHNSKRQVSCSQCDYTCTSVNALRNHANIHNTLKPHRCNFCPFSSKQSGNLKKHVQNLHLDKLGSPKRGRSLASITTVGSDNGKTSTVRSLEKCEDRKHRSASSGYRKSFVCPECDSSFVREDSLRCHLKQHGGSSNAENQMKDLKNALSAGDNAVKETATDDSIYGCQGIQHIVAAASKLSQDSGNSKKSTVSKIIDLRDITKSESEPPLQAYTNDNEKLLVDEQTVQSGDIAQKSYLPWEHRSYTLNVDSPSDRCPVTAVDVKRHEEHQTSSQPIKRRRGGDLPPGSSTHHHNPLPAGISQGSSFSPDTPGLAVPGCLETAFMVTQKGESSSSLDPSPSIQLVHQPSSVQHVTTDLSFWAQELIGQLMSHDLHPTKIQILLPHGTAMLHSVPESDTQ